MKEQIKIKQTNKQEIIWKVILSIIVVLNIFILILEFSLARDRQYILLTNGEIIIHDYGWEDVGRTVQLQPTTKLESGVGLKVIRIYQGIDSQELKVKLPNGKIGFIEADFMQHVNFEIYKQRDYRSIGLVVVNAILLLAILFKPRISLMKKINLLLLLFLLASISYYLLSIGLV